MFATQVLPETLPDNDSEDENNSGIVGIIILEDKKFELRQGETKIGRDSSLCSIVIENFTISKVHAVIESEGLDDTFIYDVGSTNQTKLGKKILKPHCRYKLENNSKITLGNVIVKFILPSESTSELEERADRPNLGNLDGVPELVDIFDLPTQVTAVSSSNSNEIPVLEKLPGGFKLFKIPKQIPLKSSISCNDECKLDLNKAKQKTVYCNGSFEDSAIFSLGTQCQIYEPPQVQQNTVKNSVNNKNSETEAVNLLLNDGQDDVLCSFMSLHSPKEQNVLLKDVKSEVVDLDEVFDAQTQAQVEQFVEVKRDETNLPKRKDSFEVFSTMCKPTTSSTPLRRLNSYQPDERCREHVEEEDFIMTQEFYVSQNAIKPKSVGNLCQESETHPPLDKDSTGENNDEDMILTQTFEMSDNQSKKPSIVVQESEELNTSQDFIGTQIFPLENQPKISSKSPETAIGEVPNLNLTQRDNEDDFISTQIFEVETNNGQNEENSDRNDSDEEDFIATQTVDIPTSYKNQQQKIVPTVVETSRESSPDLLTSDTFTRNFEDSVSTQVFEPCIPSEESTRKNIVQSVVPEPTDSSGDETESDLEIILEKKDNEKLTRVKSESDSLRGSPVREENNESNSSYIFELKPETDSGVEKTSQVVHLSDSDATDCEDVTVPGPVKEEPKEIQFEDTQVLTLTLPDNYVAQKSSDDVWRGESPKFEIEKEPMSPLSLEMPNTQEIESAMNRILEKENKEETEVGKINWNVTPSLGESSPMKRVRDSTGTEVTPVKKCRTVDLKSSEKQFSKLVQAHDIAQIQPCRTRNSLRNLIENKPEVVLGKNINERSTSRRKTDPKRNGKNGDITPYLTRRTARKVSPFGERKEETSPNENQPVRVLRSSKKNSGATTNGARWTRRNSRTKNECFSKSCVNVVFTGFDCEYLEKIIVELRGKKTEDLASGDVVVADKVRRTVKFLCAIGLSIPIASPEWLLSSRREKTFLNPWNYILKDEESEEKWDFELEKALEKSKKGKLLNGFSVFATKSTKPPKSDLLAIVESCGGTPLFDYPDVWPKKTIIASCLEDKKWWPSGKCRNVKIVHYEFILSGVLRQKIDFRRYKLT